MLVLGRKVGEAIDIGEGVRVTVLAIKGNRVRIGIDAPDHIQIRREELQWQDQSFGETQPLRPNFEKGCNFAIA